MNRGHKRMISVGEDCERVYYLADVELVNMCAWRGLVWLTRPSSKKALEGVEEHQTTRKCVARSGSPQ